MCLQDFTGTFKSSYRVGKDFHFDVFYSYV